MDIQTVAPKKVGQRFKEEDTDARDEPTWTRPNLSQLSGSLYKNSNSALKNKNRHPFVTVPTFDKVSRNSDPPSALLNSS